MCRRFRHAEIRLELRDLFEKRRKRERQTTKRLEQAERIKPKLSDRVYTIGRQRIFSMEFARIEIDLCWSGFIFNARVTQTKGRKVLFSKKTRPVGKSQRISTRGKCPSNFKSRPRDIVSKKKNGNTTKIQHYLTLLFFFDSPLPNRITRELKIHTLLRDRVKVKQRPRDLNSRLQTERTIAQLRDKSIFLVQRADSTKPLIMNRSLNCTGCYFQFPVLEEMVCRVDLR